MATRLLQQQLNAGVQALKEAKMLQLNLQPAAEIPSREDLEQAFKKTIIQNDDRTTEKTIVEAFQWLLQKRNGVHWPSPPSDAAM